MNLSATRFVLPSYRYRTNKPSNTLPSALDLEIFFVKGVEVVGAKLDSSQENRSMSHRETPEFGQR